MSSAREGWYQDPTAPDRLRWWDGARWTAHTTDHPDVASSTGAGDQPAAAAPRSTPGQPASTGERTFGQPEPTGGEPHGRAPAGAPPRTEAELTPVWSTTAASPPAVPPPAPWGSPGRSAGAGSTRRGSVAALAAIAVILIIVVAGLVGLASGDRAGTDVVDVVDETVAEPGFHDEGDLVVPPDRRLESGQTLRVGGAATGQVGDGEAWVAQVDLSQASEIRVDVRGSDGFDAVATLRDADGRIVARNDDRGDDGVSRVGGDHLDPLLEAALEPGVYELEVVGFATLAGSFAVRVDPAGAS